MHTSFALYQDYGYVHALMQTAEVASSFTRDLPARNWFVAQLKPNGLSLARRNLLRQRYASFSPARLENWRGKPALRALFPGYIFVQFDPDAEGWRSINNTRGVNRLLLNDIRHPLPLPAPFMAGLIARCDGDGVLLPPLDVAAGDRIRVISGPFADLVTTVDSLGPDQRVHLLIELMGHHVRTSLPARQVEKL